MKIRPAHASDARRLGEVGVASWRAAYDGLMPEPALLFPTVEAREAAWIERFAVPAPGFAAWVAEDDDGTIIGYAAVGRTNDARDDVADEVGAGGPDPAPPGGGAARARSRPSIAVAELATIYLLPSAWGRGAGRALFRAAIEHVSLAGFRELTLWVLDTNARARAFYERMGMRPDGTTKVELLAGAELPHLRYAIPTAARIRDAGVDDVPAIAALHIAAWRAAYRGQIPDEILDGLDQDEREATWRRWIETPEPRTRRLVVDLAGRVAGIASFGPSRDEDERDPGSVCELYLLYVEPTLLRRKLGAALWSSVVELAAADGCEALTLWVLETNAAGRAFYERMGMEADGGRRVKEARGQAFVDVRYRYIIKPPSTSMVRPLK